MRAEHPRKSGRAIVPLLFACLLFMAAGACAKAEPTVPAATVTAAPTAAPTPAPTAVPTLAPAPIPAPTPVFPAVDERHPAHRSI